jgi:hypothetical protein
MKGSHANRKATKEEMAHATQVIQEAYPEFEIVWGSHGDYGGHRAPRDHTLAFRLRDKWGKYHSNVIWVAPDWRYNRAATFNAFSEFRVAQHGRCG